MPVDKKSRQPWLFGAMVFVITLLFTAGVISSSEQNRLGMEHARAQAIASDHAQVLQQNLQQALSATHALAAWVRLTHGEVPAFEALASDMLPLYPGVSALVLEPAGVVQRIFPLEGNAHALGLNLLAHPAREKEAKLARDSGQLTLAGPFELVQGGLGALGFYPVFLDNKQGQKTFWGFTNVVIRFPQALGRARFEQLARQGYDYALWRLDPATGRRQVMAQSAVLPADSVDVELAVPNARWTLSIAPAQGWADPLGLGLKTALGLLLSALLAVVTAMATATRARARGLESELSATAGRNLALNHQLQATLDALPDLLFEMDLQGCYLDAHSPRSELLAAPVNELIGKSLRDVLPQAAARTCMAALLEANEHGFSRGKQIELPLAGGKGRFELAVSRKTDATDGAVTFMVLSRDITHRKAAELKLERLTRLYAALSQCNQAIVRCQDETELFAIVCRDAVRFGGMKMAWIGRLDVMGQSVHPVASWGEGIDYLDGIVITLDPKVPNGQGPVGIAMREDRPYWCQDFGHDPATAAWHARAERFGWGSSAALPLHMGGKVIGLLSVYAGEVGAFNEEAQALLVEMVMDISYALDRFADEVGRRRVQDELRDSEERYRKAFRTSPDAVNITRMSDGLYLDVNAGFERLMGWLHAETVGKTSAEINVWRDLADRQKLLDFLRRDGRCTNLEADFVKKEGGIIHGLMSAEIVRLNEVDCILSITRDITEKRWADAQIERLAHFDQLTGLPNRNQVQAHFSFALNLAQRSGENMAVMFLDLDHFKNINDTLGHSVGDRLLVEIAQRLSAILRAEDTLSRMGGDEFILLLPAIDAEGAAQVAQKLIVAVGQPCQMEHLELVSTVSIGIAMYPIDGQDFETLSKNADTAMYRVKQASRNNFCFFTQEMQAHSARTLQLVNAMHHALARDEFALHYQPQVSLHDGHIVGVEALLRWQHPELGALSPAEFIPIAEDSGQILPIGEWVLRTAVTQLKRWLDSGMKPMVVTVNLSAVQFRHPNLLDMVTRILDEAALPAQYLELELTEATAMDDPVAAIALMNKLRERGIRMSIDDFGTGYSSLSYLKKFNIYKLKIDQSFVRDISNDPDDKAIVIAIINLARSLGMHTIAEGVETASQLAFLRLQGCDEVQGYYFSRPLPVDQFEAFVRDLPANVRPTGVPVMRPTRFSTLPDGLVALTATAHGMVGNTMVRAAQQAFGELMTALHQAHVVAQVSSFMSIVPDDAQAPDDPHCRYVAAALFGYALAKLSGDCRKPDLPLKGTLAWHDIAPGRYAVFKHIGPYDTLFQSWATIYSDWLPASGECLRDVPRLELMRNDPQTTPPELLHTEIWIPVV